jgi:hypothetical protein
MRSTLLAVAAALSLALTVHLAACGDDHPAEEHYDTLQDCVTDHTAEEGLPEAEAIVTCLVDHLDVSFTTLQECLDYVAANGGYASAQAACEDYLRQTGHAPDAGEQGAPDAAAAP